MQRLQDLIQSNLDNLNSVKHEASRHFRNKKKKCLKAQINELATKNYFGNIRDVYRDISDFKKGYHLITNVVKDENGDLITGSQSILARWRNHFPQLLNVQYMGLMLFGRQKYIQHNH
jgi:hypothetical protein